MPGKVYLSRRNLLTLLCKLDRKEKGEKTSCTLIKKDNQHEKYPQTMIRLSVVAIENDCNFTGTKVFLSRLVLRTLISELDQKKAGKEVACVAVIKEAPHPKRTPKCIEVFAIEDEEYYSSMRLPGDVYHADEPCIEEIIRGSIWSTPSVSEQPVIILERWRVLEVENKEGLVQRHFVGFNVQNCEGSVSTPIEHFDPVTGQGVTRSGRTYRLRGKPGYDSDGAWVWGNFSRVHGFSHERDVSGEFLGAIVKAQARIKE